MKSPPLECVLGVVLQSNASTTSLSKTAFSLLLLLAGIGPHLSTAAEPAGGAPGVKSPPNIVLIISDDQAWTDYSFMGHEHIRTPNLDRLAAESLVFTRGYVPSSLCCPSLASIITGLYSHQHKITSNAPSLPPGAPRQ